MGRGRVLRVRLIIVGRLLVQSPILRALNHDVAAHMRLLCLPNYGMLWLGTGNVYNFFLLPLVPLCTDNEIFTRAGTGTG